MLTDCLMLTLEGVSPKTLHERIRGGDTTYPIDLIFGKPSGVLLISVATTIN